MRRKVGVFVFFCLIYQESYNFTSFWRKNTFLFLLYYGWQYYLHATLTLFYFWIIFIYLRSDLVCFLKYPYKRYFLCVKNVFKRNMVFQFVNDLFFEYRYKVGRFLKVNVYDTENTIKSLWLYNLFFMFFCQHLYFVTACVCHLFIYIIFGISQHFYSDIMNIDGKWCMT